MFSQPGVAGRRAVCLRASLPSCLRGAVYPGGEERVAENHAVLFQLRPLWVSGARVPECCRRHPCPSSGREGRISRWTPDAVVTCPRSPCLSRSLPGHATLQRLFVGKRSFDGALLAHAHLMAQDQGFPTLTPAPLGLGTSLQGAGGLSRGCWQHLWPPLPSSQNHLAPVPAVSTEHISDVFPQKAASPQVENHCLRLSN